MTYVRIDGLLYSNQTSTMLSLYELLTVIQDIGQIPNFRNSSLSRNALNSYLFSNVSSNKGYSPYLVNLTND